CQQDYGWPLTF
nr:immunoglobulin light chain junction region [Macaca mulatta]MOW42840.1 immunoglobulin light chain junction region [Macaca mulatta]